MLQSHRYKLFSCIQLVSNYIAGTIYSIFALAYQLEKMPSALAKEVRSRIVAIIGGKQPILTRLADLEEYLLQQHLMTLTSLPVARLKTHMVNRSGLGVNPHEVHRLGHSVSQVGFSMEELDIWAIDGANTASNQHAQEAFNKALISNSKSLLAPLKGSEDHNMVAGNHMVQFLRATEHGCRTPISDMQDSDKQLDKHKLLKKGYDKPLAPKGVPVKVVKFLRLLTSYREQKMLPTASSLSVMRLK